MCTYTHAYTRALIYTKVRTHNESVNSHCWDRLNSKAVPQPFQCRRRFFLLQNTVTVKGVTIGICLYDCKNEVAHCLSKCNTQYSMLHVNVCICVCTHFKSKTWDEDWKQNTIQHTEFLCSDIIWIHKTTSYNCCGDRERSSHCSLKKHVNIQKTRKLTKHKLISLKKIILNFFLFFLFYCCDGESHILAGGRLLTKLFILLIICMQLSNNTMKNTQCHHEITIKIEAYIFTYFPTPLKGSPLQ